MNEHLELIERAMRDKNMVVVYRDKTGGAYYGGFPAAMSRQLCVLQKEDSFRLDGYVAFRTGDVTYAEQYDDNDFCRAALKGENVYGQVRPLGFGCGGWKELLEGIIREYGGWLSVECEGADETLYYVGRAASADDRYLSMRRVDADGRWHDITDSLPLDEITLVTFGDNYLNVFRKYCK